MSTTIYADSWTGSAATGKVTQRAYMTYTVNQTATTYQIIIQSGVQQWNPTWTKIKTVCTLTDQSSVTKTLTQSSGANHLHQFFNVTYATITKTSSAQSKTITGTSKITGGVDSAHGSGTVLNKTSTVSHVFTIPAELKVSGSTLISKTFSTSEQTATLAATGGTSPYTFTELGEEGSTNYFSISGSTLKIAANTPAGSHSYRVQIKDADGVTISVNYEIRIAKANISPTVSMANWTYGGTASTPSVSGNPGGGTVTYHYKVSTAADSTYTTTKPSNAGTYTVRATIAATTNYNAGTATKNFTINKANISPTVTMANWAYGGTASNPSVSGNSGNGTVTYNYKLKSAADSTYSTTKPSDAGTYTIRASIAATTNYNAGTATKDFSITFTATPTAYSAQYNGSAHSASIKTSVGGAKVEYGTSTSYGYSLTTTTANTNYTMSSVSATNVADSKTVYYKATKNGYTVTGSTSITITKATPNLSVTGKTNLTYTGSVQALVSAWSVTGGGKVYLGIGSSSTTAPTSWSTNASPTATNAGTYYIWAKADASTNYNAVSQVYKISVIIAKATPTLSVTGVTVNYTGSVQTLVSAASVTGNGTIYYGLGSSSSSAPSSWSTTKPARLDVGTYYIWAKADASANYNAVSQVYKASATIKPVMWLKFNANGGTIADSPHKYSDTQYFKLNNGIVQGCSTANGTYSDITYTINTSTTFLNVWNVTSYNITRTGYSVKSGAAAFKTASGIEVNQDNTAAGDTNPITTKRINGGTEITTNITYYLYVNWKPNTYTVTLNANNGSGGTGSVTATYDAAMPSATMPTRAGYTFQGYYDTSAATGGTQYYTSSGASARTWNKTAATTLYARWSVNTYTITLNANGGSGGTGSVNIVYGTTKGNYPSITKPTRTGYTFNGFYSATSGGTQWYDANGNSVRTFDLTANTTWYAQWTINSYALTIDPNGGSWNNSSSVSTVSQNYATTKAIAAPTRTGYTFVGWAETGPGHLSKINQTDPAFDSSSGGVAIYNNSGGGTVTHTRQSSSAGTAYGSYEILISSSSGTTSPGNGGFYQPTTSAANKKYIHAFVAKIPTGYTVQQACNATGDGRTITWLTDRYGTGAYRVYAYQHNCGSTGTFSTFGHVYLDTGSRPVSWQLAYSAMKDITDGTADTYTYGAGAGRITALWAGNKYSVAFNANGGSGSMTTQTDFFYGTAKALSANGFTAPSGGYSFIGWATSAANAAAGTVAYSNQGNMTTGTTTNGGTVTLYAVWRRTITFKHGKANATTSTVYQYYGGNVTPPTITTISTWTPLGWRDDTSASAKEYGANNTTAFAYTSTVQTLYAVYSRTLTISYGANGGTGTTPSNTTTTQYYNANGAITSPAITLATNPYSQTGCTFSHWLVSTSNTNVASGGSYTWSIAVDASTVSRVASAQWNINVTATNGNATYNGSAHSASISIGIAGATVEYGTSTSYGYTLTATNANTNYSMSSVSATTVAQSTTVYYRVSKSGYLARTGSTTVTISKRTVTPTAPTLTTGTLTYDGTAKTLASAGSCTAGGQMYYYVGTSATAPAFNTSTWSTSISTQINAGTYYVFWYCYVSDTANNNDTSSDNINITKSLGSRTIGNATLTITPTAYSADYNGIAHSAQIKCTNADGVTIAYGTSTSYGNTLTATSKNTNYAMSSVTRTNPGTTTVYYKASKTNYNDVTGSTTIVITGVPVHSNINGTWKHGIVYVNVNGTWKKATAGYRNVNGTWKPINK